VAERKADKLSQARAAREVRLTQGRVSPDEPMPQTLVHVAKEYLDGIRVSGDDIRVSGDDNEGAMVLHTQPPLQAEAPAKPKKFKPPTQEDFAAYIGKVTDKFFQKFAHLKMKDSEQDRKNIREAFSTKVRQLMAGGMSFKQAKKAIMSKFS
jgi:hypothetical protein